MATQVDFYILNDERQQAYWLFCCRLLQKIYLKKHNIYVHCSDHNTAKQLDTQLWTFNDISFIPHSLTDTAMELTPMVLIGYTDEPPTTTDILLNLSSNIPSFFPQFSRILEVIAPQASAAGRQRYRQYQQQQCQLQTHKLGN